MPKHFSWTDAITFLEPHSATFEGTYEKVIWQRIQNGDRTQDLLMQVSAMKDLQDVEANNSPEWQEAIKWLTIKRASEKSLILDMLASQLETGERTPELLALIQDQMTK